LKIFSRVICKGEWCSRETLGRQSWVWNEWAMARHHRSSQTWLHKQASTHKQTQSASHKKGREKWHFRKSEIQNMAKGMWTTHSYKWLWLCKHQAYSLTVSLNKHL